MRSYATDTDRCAPYVATFTHNPNYRPSPVALEFPAPATALDAVMQRAVTGYADEAELLTAFRETTPMLFAQEGQQGVYTVTENDGSHYVPASPTPPTPPTPGTSGTTPPATNSRPRESRCGSIRGSVSA